MKVNMDKIRQYEGSMIYSPIWIIFFPATFILSDFIHILLSYCLFRKKHIPNTFLHNI